jgi:DNA-binding MarR family transcriptional regulator
MLKALKPGDVVVVYAAVERGSKMGRPRGMTEDEERAAMKLWATGRYTKTELARRYNVHMSSVKRAIRRAGLAQKRPGHAAQLPLAI